MIQTLGSALPAVAAREIERSREVVRPSNAEDFISYLAGHLRDRSWWRLLDSASRLVVQSTEGYRLLTYQEIWDMAGIYSRPDEYPTPGPLILMSAAERLQVAQSSDDPNKRKVNAALERQKMLIENGQYVRAKRDGFLRLV